MVAYCPYCGVSQRESVSVPPLPPAMAAKKVPPPLPAAVQASPVVLKPVPPPIVEPAEKRKIIRPVDSAAISGPSHFPETKASVGVPPVHSHVESSKSHAWKYVATAVVVVGAGVGIFFAQKSSQQEVACNASLTDATAQFTSGNVDAARGLATQVVSTCSADVRLRAVELLAALDKVAVAKTDCDKTLRTITSQVADRNMVSARNALDQLDNICTDTAAAKDLRQKVVENQTISATIEAELRSLLMQGDAKAAGAALERLTAQNREHPDLASLKTEILVAMKAIEASAAVAEVALPPPAPEALPAPLPSPPAASQRAANTASAGAGQSELAREFLRDAEQSLAQQKFDAAKTFVESARRVDPMNAQAAVLWRRIKDRELQYLKEETSIK